MSGVPVTAIPYNPTPTTWAVPGEGSYLSIMDPNPRISMGLGKNDALRIIGDTRNKAYCIWNGANFADANNEFVDIRMYGAVGDGFTNDIQALRMALYSGCKNIHFPKGYTFLLDHPEGLAAAYNIDVPSGTVFKIDGTLVSTTGKTITYNLLGDFGAYGTGTVWFSQGTNPRVFTFNNGIVWARGLTFRGIGSGNNPWYWVCQDPGSGFVESFSLVNCKFLNFCGFGYLRESTAGSPHYVASTLIEGCEFSNIYNGSAVLINDVAGRDRNTVIIGNSISGVLGSLGADPFSGFGIAVAGFSVLPFNTYDCLQDLIIAGNEITACSSCIHVEYCGRFLISGNKVDDVNASYYPARNGEGGIVVYGCNNWAAVGNKVSNVSGDSSNVWGIVARGGYSGAYQQSNRDFALVGNTLVKASMLLDQQVQSNAIGGIQPYELTTSSRLDVLGNTINQGVCLIYSVATLNLRDNTFTAPTYSSIFSVVSYYRNANVASITVTLPHADLGMTIGDLVCVAGVGAGFDSQFAVVTGVFPSIATFTYANVGANVGTTPCIGTVYVMKKALTIDASNDSSGNTDYKSLYRLCLTIENNRASDIYGCSSFDIRGLPDSRVPSNIQIHVTGNNFGFNTDAASYFPVYAMNRCMVTSQGSVPNGVEYVIGDQISINIGGGGAHKNYITTVKGYVGPLGDTYAIVSAPNGQIRRTGATSWIGYPQVYSYGEKVQLTNGANSIVGIVLRVYSSGGNEIIDLVDPATGTALDLTSVGGPGTIAPYEVASFVLF